MKKNYLIFALAITTIFFFTKQNLQAQNRVADSIALVALYNNNGGAGWVHSTNWLTAQPIDTWYGIHVSATGRIDSVSLSGNNLINVFPNTINTITALAKFDVSHNNLTGIQTYPTGMGYLNNDSLIVLNTSYNQISGSIYYYSLPSLAVLLINNNNFSSGIGAVANFARIKEINASHNSFTDALPYFGPNVIDSINLSYNQLKGSISYYNYPTCNYYNVSHNQLSGSWGYFNGLVAKAALDVSHNKFTFNELEPVITSLPAVCTYAPQDTLLPAHYTGGKLSVNAGGTYSKNIYTWYKGNIMQAATTGDSTFTPTSAGNYAVSVTNSVASALTLHSDTASVSLFSAITAVTPASSCGAGNDGSLNVYVTGGKAPFSYVLTLPAGGTITQPKNYFANLATGTYSVTITDKNNNNVTNTDIVIAKADTITAKAAAYPASLCGNGNDGSILAGANGGVAPYHYVLMKPNNSAVAQQAALFGSLTPGNYSITATDAKGCTASLTGIAVAQAAPIAVTPIVSLASNCGSGNDGKIQAINTGGAAPFHYILKKPDNSTVAQRNPAFNNLATGTYSLTVVDTGGCSSTLSGIVIAKAQPIVVGAGTTQASSCGNGNDGTINVGRTGGVYPFHYLLTKPDNSTVAQTNYVFNNLAVGTYSLTVTDTAGCTGTQTGITITRAAAVAPKAAATAASSCGSGTDGSILAGANGGVAPYHYILTKPDNSTIAQNPALFSNLSPGIYSLTATDVSGCTGNTLTAIVVKGSAKLTIAPVALPTTACNYNNNENLNVVTTGGTAPFTYSLTYTYANTPFITQKSPLFKNLNGGNYNISVKDTAGCTATASNFVMPEGPHPYFIDTASKAPSCITATDGSITAGITGGTSPYTFYLEDGGYRLLKVITNDNPTFSGLADGSYIISASDANTCGAGYSYFTLNTTTPCTPPAAAPATTTAPDAIAGKQAGTFSVQALPNPTTTVFILAVASPKNDAVEITVTDLYGRTVHHARGAGNGRYSFGEAFGAGVYIARVMQGHEIRTVKLIKQ